MVSVADPPRSLISVFYTGAATFLSISSIYIYIYIYIYIVWFLKNNSYRPIKQWSPVEL
jgi:hypothetical protein